MKPKLINIIGPGSIGTLLAIKLSEQSYPIQLYGRANVEKQRVNCFGPMSSTSAEIDCLTFTQWFPPSHIIISVKAHGLEDVCHQLASLEQPLPPILLMMNGLGLVELVNKILPSAAVYQASTTVGVKSVYGEQHTAKLPMEISYTGKGLTLIGDFSEGTKERPAIAIRDLIEALNLALPNTRWNVRHKEALLIKLLINAVINPLTALYDCDNGAIVEQPSVHAHAKSLITEMSPVIEKYLPEETLQSIFEKVMNVAKRTRTNVSSMRQDILCGRPTEIDYISGYLLTLAQTNGLRLEEHKKLFQKIKALEK
jgi:2-dehydropantoate 2-reductase